MASFLDYFLPQGNALVPQGNGLPQDQRDAANFQGLLNASAVLADMSAPQAGPKKTILQMVTGGLQGYGNGVQGQLKNFYDDQQSQAQIGLLQAKAMGRGGEIPANVREWQYFNQLSPQDQELFLNMKRPQKVLDLGGQQVVRSPMGGISETYGVTPRPEQMPTFKGQQEEAMLQQRSIYNPQITRDEEQGRKDVQLAMNPRIANAEKASADQANDALTNPIIQKLKDLNANSFGSYAGEKTVLSRFDPSGLSNKQAIATDQLMQARIEIAAPLAKQLGVNPTDKDFQASLDRIFNLSSTKESRAAQIDALAAGIEAKKSIRSNQLKSYYDTPTQRTQPSLDADEQALRAAVRPSNNTNNVGSNGGWSVKVIK